MANILLLFLPTEVLWQAVYDQPSLAPGLGFYPGLWEWDNGNTLSDSAVDSNDVGASTARPLSGLVKAGPNGGYAMYMGITPTTTAQAACRTFRNAESSRNIPLHYFFDYGILNAEVDINGIYPDGPFQPFIGFGLVDPNQGIILKEVNNTWTQVIVNAFEATFAKNMSHNFQLLASFTKMNQQVSSFKATQAYLDQQVKMWTSSNN